MTDKTTLTKFVMFGTPMQTEPLSKTQKQMVAEAAAEIKAHTVKFERNTVSGSWRARCSCGWYRIGERDEVQSRAATHDMEWVPVEQAQAV